ncbi:MAG: T9SS type A sorting domain-containing protein [Bacteroidetes bacterium]|nr:T9SS type A sorting domain-containing protein [Bacteroidota bacterium]
MKKTLLSASLVLTIFANAQNSLEFNEAAALQEAQQKGIALVDYQGYINKKQWEWKKANGLIKQAPVVLADNTPVNLTAQSATNIDFETGDYTGWTTEIGWNGGFPAADGVINGIHATPVGPVNKHPHMVCYLDSSYRHGLMNVGANTDSIIMQSSTSPLGGNYVARVGRYCASNEASILKQTFNVTSGQHVLQVAYLPILDAGWHMLDQAQFITISVLDSNNDTVQGAYLELKDVTTGYNQVTYNLQSVSYKNWQIYSFNLSNYIGQNVTIKVEAAACTWSGHSAYCYFDAKLGGTSLSVDDIMNARVSLYPNPSKDILTIESKDVLLSTYQIVNMLGESVMTGSLTNSNTIDISQLSKGAYVIKASSAHEIISKRFVKE